MVWRNASLPIGGRMDDFHENPVVLRGNLPLRLAPWPEDESAMAAVMADNWTLLRALVLMDDKAAGGEEEGKEAMGGLETKVDLLLLLVSAGLKGMEPAPPVYPCVLGGQYIHWGCGDPAAFPDVGERCCLALFLRPRIAMPLILPGIMQAVIPGQGGVWCQLHFHLDEHVQESLDRLIFRHHRREVARSRQRTDPPG